LQRLPIDGLAFFSRFEAASATAQQRLEEIVAERG
jgi:hypothetical protein